MTRQEMAQRVAEKLGLTLFKGNLLEVTGRELETLWNHLLDLEEEVERLRKRVASAKIYEFGDDIEIQRRAQGWHYAEGRGEVVDGKELWAIVRRSCVLNKLGEWEHEPLPSSRTEEFLERSRWNSYEEALEVVADLRSELEENKS